MKDQTEVKGLDQQQTGMVMENSYIPVGSPDVQEMITQKLYADKTAYIVKLFRTNGIYYFFIRPRRFGKSLLLDTIDQIAKGNKELFKACVNILRLYAGALYRPGDLLSKFSLWEF